MKKNKKKYEANIKNMVEIRKLVGKNKFLAYQAYSEDSAKNETTIRTKQ
jgi:hypothetical protein